jgi:hypothetical protein
MFASGFEPQKVKRDVGYYSAAGRLVRNGPSKSMGRPGEHLVTAVFGVVLVIVVIVLFAIHRLVRP